MIEHEREKERLKKWDEFMISLVGEEELLELRKREYRNEFIRTVILGGMLPIASILFLLYVLFLR